MYNGLEDELKLFSKFVFIYEKKIKNWSKVDEFAELSKIAGKVFKHDIQPLVKFATKEEIANRTDGFKQTLFFTRDGKAPEG